MPLEIFLDFGDLVYFFIHSLVSKAINWEISWICAWLGKLMRIERIWFTKRFGAIHAMHSLITTRWFFFFFFFKWHWLFQKEAHQHYYSETRVELWVSLLGNFLLLFWEGCTLCMQILTYSQIMRTWEKYFYYKSGI